MLREPVTAASLAMTSARRSAVLVFVGAAMFSSGACSTGRGGSQPHDGAAPDRPAPASDGGPGAPDGADARGDRDDGGASRGDSADRGDGAGGGDSADRGDSAGAGDSAEGGATDGAVIAPGLHLLAGALGGLGNADDVGADARFGHPAGATLDGAGNVYVVDNALCTIRRLVVATGAVTTLAGATGVSGFRDGVGADAVFANPTAVVYGGDGSLYVADPFNGAIRKVAIATGAVTTLAGPHGNTGADGGAGTPAPFVSPVRLVADGAGSLYVADSYLHAIWKVALATGDATAVAGAPGMSGSEDGSGASARFDQPNGVAIGADGNLYVADTLNDTVRKVVLATRAVTTLAGSPGLSAAVNDVGSAARFVSPSELAADRDGNLYVGDAGSTIRKVALATRAVTTFAGAANEYGYLDGAGAASRFQAVGGMALDTGGGALYVADFNNDVIRKVTLPDAVVTTVAGLPRRAGDDDGVAGAARFIQPWALASDGRGNLYVSDVSSLSIRKVTVATGAATTIAGGPQSSPTPLFIGPQALAFESTGAGPDTGNLYVADSGDQTIRRVLLPGGQVTTVAGAAGLSGNVDGIGSAARFSTPSAVAADGAGTLYVAELQNQTIRKIALATGTVTTLVPVGGGVSTPTSLALDGAGSLYVGDATGAVRKVAVATGQVTTVMAADSFSTPTALALDGAGNLYVTNSTEHVIRRVTLATGQITTVLGVRGRLGVKLGPLPGGLSQPEGLAFVAPGLLAIANANEPAILLASF